VHLVPCRGCTLIRCSGWVQPSLANLAAWWLKRSMAEPFFVSPSLGGENRPASRKHIPCSHKNSTNAG
jgi:hypothetical protein